MALYEADPVVRATRCAMARAKRRGSHEVTPDDLLIGALQTVARFSIALIGPWTIDLETLGDSCAGVREPVASGGPGRPV